MIQVRERQQAVDPVIDDCTSNLVRDPVREHRMVSSVTYEQDRRRAREEPKQSAQRHDFAALDDSDRAVRSIGVLLAERDAGRLDGLEDRAVYESPAYLGRQTFDRGVIVSPISERRDQRAID